MGYRIIALKKYKVMTMLVPDGKGWIEWMCIEKRMLVVMVLSVLIEVILMRSKVSYTKHTDGAKPSSSINWKSASLKQCQ